MGRIDLNNLKAKVVNKSQLPHGCILVDISLRDFGVAWSSLLKSQNLKQLEASIQDKWNSEDQHEQSREQVLVALSCRTILDLWLQVKKFPPGSQVLIGAINIPDVITVLRYHKLVPVPIDVDADTLEPSIDLMERHVNKKVVAVFIAHIYGRHLRMEQYVRFAQDNNLQLIEDLAEGFAGFAYTGHPKADLSFVSFGTIKTNTSLGGSVGRVESREVLSQMHEVMKTYPITSNFTYAKKLLKTLPIWCITNVEYVAYALLVVSYAIGFNHKKAIVEMIRGFPGDQLVQKIRAKIPLPMLNVLSHRLNTFDDKRFITFTKNVDEITTVLLREKFTHSLPFFVPGMKCVKLHYWLYPVMVTDPEQYEKALNSCGVDATTSSTQLTTVALPFGNELLPGQEVPSIPISQALLKHVLYLPIHFGPNKEQLKRIITTFLMVVKLDTGPIPDTLFPLLSSPPPSWLNLSQLPSKL